MENQEIQSTEYESECCDICGDKHNNESLILQCGHKYHYMCILQTFKTINERECPYCRQKSNLLEYNNKYPGPYKNIHKFCTEMINHERCHGLIVSGERKNLQCNNYPSVYIDKVGYCKKHSILLKNDLKV